MAMSARALTSLSATSRSAPAPALPARPLTASAARRLRVRVAPSSSSHRRARPAFTTSASKRPSTLTDEDLDIKVRAEVEAPFRIVRLVLYGFFAGSASVGAAIALTQTLAAAAGAAGAPVPLAEAAQSLGIDLAAAGLFAFLFSRDWAARQKQLARLGREGALGAQKLTLATGKAVRLRDLRGFARPVLVCGTADQVKGALDAVTPDVKAKLQERGVLVVPVVLEGGASSPTPALPPPGPGDARWRATPSNPPALAAWFADQAAVAGADPSKGLYVGLRMDGRVRASGTGCPPWAAFAAQLPPVGGMWEGFGDGFDGRV